jgi:hypothetical protein
MHINLDKLAFTRQDAQLLMHVFNGIVKRFVVPGSCDVSGADLL